MENNYYVYGYIRLDTNTYFYIGKGKDDRWKSISQRPQYFKNILNKTECVVEILYDNLTEYDAFQLEVTTIYDLVFNEGYSIDIKGISKNNDGKHLVNCTWGGEGASGRNYKPSNNTIKKLKESHKGQIPFNKGVPRDEWMSEEGKQAQKESQIWNIQNNPNYGMRGKHHSEESKQKMSKSKTGISSKLSEEDKKRRGQKIKDIRIKNNSYGHSDETKSKISNTLKGRLTGAKNGMSKTIICLNDNKIFESCRLACAYYNIATSNLCRALKQNKTIKGLKFMYLKDYNANND